jgi:hypothetical protein
MLTPVSQRVEMIRGVVSVIITKAVALRRLKLVY